ncbi:SIMPL domain-containing protein [Salinimicrobium sp. TH3]|uniref:SIMPL domain-containing protein n=1 Tax=Salinimicrobium sp. TH3 TaxID=2997342 RepID=UPI00227304B0|nr:SIMPL domain-containing protein [Salinimicrobium sp. TH3]MCY2686916.1 SIMPL domain-containing protein [Salinimicrobium sp. TH3]
MKKYLLLIAILGYSFGFAQEKSIPSISVLGTGTVNIVPDKVLINSRIEHTGKTAAEVKRKNDNVVDQVIKFLESQGVASKNIQTEYIRLNKEVNYNTQDTMYSANQAISIELLNLKDYEKIMSGLLDSGLNRIDGIEFRTSRKDDLQSEARKNAVLNAKMKAEEYATALGQSAGKAIHISEVQTNNYQPVYRVMEMKADSAEQQSIAPGEMEITVKVNVEFLLNEN